MEDSDTAGDGAAAQVAELADRLTAARITATSPRNIARAVYDGHGRAISLELRPGAKLQHSPESMSEMITAALQAADRAVDALRQHAYDDVRVAGDTIGNWRRHPADPGAAVAAAFGTQG
ncbi:YbaB/EbfC family nucleoid-associated protein [Phytomonospora sp. NPDC050363]|uniref:YbaB/EbfC family nucleoid-associated protein n=1 Tax=Phytomonospora sp. NPDC050363 TaxID=3155642 RepID=UPI0033DE2C1A